VDSQSQYFANSMKAGSLLHSQPHLIKNGLDDDDDDDGNIDME